MRIISKFESGGLNSPNEDLFTSADLVDLNNNYSNSTFNNNNNFFNPFSNTSNLVKNKENLFNWGFALWKNSLKDSDKKNEDGTDKDDNTLKADYQKTNQYIEFNNLFSNFLNNLPSSKKGGLIKKNKR